MAAPKVELRDVNFVYQPATPLAYRALTNINLRVSVGAFTVLVGQTGSGKSTLVNLIDALTVPTSGQVIINGHAIDQATPKKKLDQYRQQVGFVFQFPERQLFAQTVREDIAFGPTNLGWSGAEIDQSVQQALKAMQLAPDILDRSPFALSGGQMRRVAIAGVLAMKPDILILDEPAVGLDSLAVRQLMSSIATLNRQGVTIIMITHYLEMILPLATQIIALHQGKLVFDGAPKEFFSNHQLLTDSQLLAPQSIAIAQRLGLDSLPLTTEQLGNDIITQLRLRGGKHE